MNTIIIEITFEYFIFLNSMKEVWSFDLWQLCCFFRFILTGENEMTQPVMSIMVSFKALKKSSKAFPCSFSLAKAMPRMSEKTTKPIIFVPSSNVAFIA